MRFRALVTLPLGALGACSAVTPDIATPAPPTPAACRNEALATFIGKRADQRLGTEMLAASGARSLRWVAPGMAVTMDYRPDRLTVVYDGHYHVTRAACG